MCGDAWSARFRSTRPDNRFGTDEEWDVAEESLRDALERHAAGHGAGHAAAPGARRGDEAGPHHGAHLRDVADLALRHGAAALLQDRRRAEELGLEAISAGVGSALTLLAKVVGARAVADKMVSAMGEPMLIGNQHLNTSCSVGISLFPADGRDSATLMNKGLEVIEAEMLFGLPPMILIGAVAGLLVVGGVVLLWLVFLLALSPPAAARDAWALEAALQLVEELYVRIPPPESASPTAACPQGSGLDDIASIPANLRRSHKAVYSACTRCCGYSRSRRSQRSPCLPPFSRLLCSLISFHLTLN